MKGFPDSRFFNIYILIFTVLLVFAVLLPELVERIMHLFGELSNPRNNSVIVFKEMAERQEIVKEFLKLIKKLTNFM